MTASAYATEFLGQLERAELAVLSWGIVDGFFSEEELEGRAERFLSNYTRDGGAPAPDSAWDLVEELLDEHLLWRLPDSGRYRTRMAESVRLFCRLRQIFPDAQNASWRTAPNLVADYRLIARPRLYPIREVALSQLLDRLREGKQRSMLEERVIGALVRDKAGAEKRLAQFQVRAAERILNSAGPGRAFGTVVCAGTGSGKTLAFFLPVYTAIASQLSGEYWTKCLALYPRNELLKDQLREALANARRIAPSLVQGGKRKLILAALYGDVPHSGMNLLSDPGNWRRCTIAGESAYECPFIRCSRCGQRMAWLERDIQREWEQVQCTADGCAERIEPDEIRLTRKRMLAEPPDVLFTSTEMLNQRLSATRYGRLFGVGVQTDRRPQFVLIDEVHAYEGVHGAHVALLLRRWRRATEAQPHFVGLSATLADAPRFFAELVGIGPGDVSEVGPEQNELRGEGGEYMLALRGDPSSGTSLLSTSIQALMLLRRVLGTESNSCFGTRAFAFTDNLDVTNRLYHNLLDAEGWDARGRPNVARAAGSLANIRGTTLPNARERFDLGQNWALVEDVGHSLAPGSRVRIGRTSSQDVGVDANADIIVATAALEVGFDDPEVGAVLQHKAPHSAAAFLQRKGRAGRRQLMRPWTAVVLSDYGRDRLAYQSYDQLFSPQLPPRHLPLRNRAVLKMQATYALCDWLAHRLPQNEFPDPWTDLSQPASDIENTKLASYVARRQSLYVQYLRSLLEQGVVRDEFSYYLRRSLAVEEHEIIAILWEPPRALLTEAVPTLLRRLEGGWRRADGSGLEEHAARVPLPEFVPRTLFSDLQLPEVSVRIPAQGPASARVESMPVAQALREFAPGRVSRRFGVSHGRERYWIAPGNGSEVSVEAFCPASDRQELGRFRYIAVNGTDQEIRVFRPYAIDVSPTPPDVQQSSNSFLHWRTEIVPVGTGHGLDMPLGSRWLDVLRSISVHSHGLGLPLEIRRFAPGATASVGRGRGQQVVSSVRFVCTRTDGGFEAAALGFVGDVDGIQVTFEYPSRIFERCARDAVLLQGLRVARFRDLIRSARDLDGIANDFQRDWLSQVYLSTITAVALRETMTLGAAESAVHLATSSTTTREVLETILQWSEADSDDTDPVDEQVLPRRLQELAELLDQPQVKEALHREVPVLWEDLSETWEHWLRLRFKSTLGAALVEAAHSLCPQIGGGTLILDLQAAVDRSNLPTSPGSRNLDELWLTESTIGGGGFVEDFLGEYVHDPRRFFRLFEASLAPSDLEFASTELRQVVRLAATDQWESDSLAPAFAAVRDASSHTEQLKALSMLRAQLVRNGVQPTPTLLIALSLRVLRPGTAIETDRFLERVLQEWDNAEERLGIDIDARVFAFVKSSDTSLEVALRISGTVEAETINSSWRYGVLYGMFWPRGAQIRSQSLRLWNPFEQLPDSDRLLALAVVPRSTREVAVSSPEWFEELTTALVQNGVVDLVGRTNESEQLATALLRIGREPVDSEALLVYARVTGVRRDRTQIVVEIELPEAFQ
jgi:hypothetical protein